MNLKRHAPLNILKSMRFYYGVTADGDLYIEISLNYRWNGGIISTSTTKSSVIHASPAISGEMPYSLLNFWINY